MMSLDEWKELQEQSRPKVDYQVRKAGEGEKKGQWKNTSILKKEGEDELIPSRRVRFFHVKIYSIVARQPQQQVSSWIVSIEN